MPDIQGDPNPMEPGSGGEAVARSERREELPDERLELIPARMVNEYVYCPRLFYLEFVQTEFADSEDTVSGRSGHRRVDRPSGAAPAPQETEEGATEPEGEPGGSQDGEAALRATSVMLSAPMLGAVAKMDVLKTLGSVAVPLDFKHGSRPDVPGGAFDPEKVQICIQGLILRENGYRVDHGEIYFLASKERVRIDFDEELERRSREALSEARRVAREGRIPDPLVDSPKCPRCSLVGICLPDELNYLRRDRTMISQDDVRRLIPTREDSYPLYVQAQGHSVGRQGEVVQVRASGQVEAETRMVDISQLCIFGAVQVSTQLIQECCRREIPVCYFSYGGWFNGRTAGVAHKNVDLRIRQYATARDPSTSLGLARRFVRGKILNARTILRRNHRSIPKIALTELTRLGYVTSRCKDMQSLLGIEGAGARLYFGHFGNLLRKGMGQDLPDFEFECRNRRPPRDPINCMLSFLYALLCKDLVVTTQSIGFDPYLGFYHQPRYGRPALALDLMEEFRPIVADSVVLQLVNTGEIRRRDFVQVAGACTLTSGGRKTVIEAYERRMDTSITHPLFGYAVTYRRILEVQARLLARFLLGEIEEYPVFRTR